MFCLFFVFFSRGTFQNSLRKQILSLRHPLEIALFAVQNAKPGFCEDYTANHPFKAKWGWINATTIGVNSSNQRLLSRACKHCYVFPANHLSNTITSYNNLDKFFQGEQVEQVQARKMVLALSLTHSPGRAKMPVRKRSISAYFQALVSSHGHSARAEVRHDCAEAGSVPC